jgi:hypothetical protein
MIIRPRLVPLSPSLHGKEPQYSDDIKKWMMVLVTTQLSRMDEMASLVVGEREAVQDIMKSKDDEIRKLKDLPERQVTVVNTVAQTKDKIKVKTSKGQDGGKDIQSSRWR